MTSPPSHNNDNDGLAEGRPLNSSADQARNPNPDSNPTPPNAALGMPTFRQECVDFWRFVRHPSPSPRLSGRAVGTGWEADWRCGTPVKRLLQWALLLWVLNLFVLGPVAVSVAGLSGSEHRLDMHNIPWLTGLLWAPLVEEMAFRYGLRRPIQALWFTPLAFVPVLVGPQGWTAGLVMLMLLVAWWGVRHAPVTVGGAWRGFFHSRFGWIFHLSALGFAAMHLNNFKLGDIAFWLVPALVLPQYATGLVLGWLRVRRGIGASVCLHAMFNGGPLLLVWLVMTFAPESVQLP